MTAVVVDTQSLIWFLLRSSKLSLDGRSALNQAVSARERIHIASISLVEMVYLTEKQKIPQAAQTELQRALADPNTSFAVAPLTQGISQAVADIPRGSVPDMPDRIIAATAYHLSLPLVTSDREIRSLTVIRTIW